MANAVRIAVTGTSEDAQRAINAANKAARDASTQGLADLKASLLSLAPAALPVVAAAAPLAAHLGAGAVAAAAFGAALMPQVKALGDVTAAQGKYDKAVQQYGPHSTQAVAASDALAQSISSLPPETQKAAAAFLNLKSTYKSWSDELSKATVPVFTKSIEVANALLPKTSGLVLGASTQFDRLITLLGGAVASPGFDALDKRFTDFATGSLKSATDGVVHLARVLSQGSANGPVQQFIDYARKEGPAVRETLENLGKALLHIGGAAANAGPGMLTIVNALAKLAASIPEPVLTRMIQLYTAAKLIGTTSAGIMAVSRALEASAARAVLAGRAFTAAGSGAAGMSAAVGTLSGGAVLTGAVAGLALLTYGVKKLIDAGDKAGPSTEELSRELVALAAGASVAAPGMSTLRKELDKFGGGGGAGSDPFGAAAAAKDFGHLDQALAGLVSNGHPEEATAALAAFQQQTGKKIPTEDLKKYSEAQADAAYETKLTAQSMGVFGQQSIEVQKTLDANKQSAQGLQQAIFDLNDAFRAGLDAQSDYQQAIDDATKAIKGHENALHFANGELDLSTQAARDAYAPLSKLAGTAEAASTAALQQGKSQEYANKILIDAHAQLVRAGEAMGLTSRQANKLADELDNIKDPKIKVTGTAAQLNATINAANKKIAAMPKHHTTAVNGDIAQLRSVVREAQNSLRSLKDKTVSIKTTYSVVGGTGTTVAHEGGGYASGGPVGLGRRAGTAATGGPRNNLTWVGEGGPELVNLAPGSSVRPHANSMMDARGGGGAQRVVLEIRDKGHTAYSAFLVQVLREAVDTRGGNVQLAIMGRG